MNQTLHPTIFRTDRPGAFEQNADPVALLSGLIPPARPQSLYVHIPFCFHKCHYCDFYSIVDDRSRQEHFTARLVEELLRLRPFLTPPARTIFVGGGTPTLLETALWKRLLPAIHALAQPQSTTEFTVEANPETVTAELLDVLVAGGVNRLSLGAQSFHPTHLKMLERWHEPASVPRAVELARAAGVANLSLDLIFAIPGESLDDWLADLDAALALGPNHLSCYALTYEPNTPLAARLAEGSVRRADEDLEAEMFLTTRQRLREAGFEAYEISNFARPGCACRHNLAYWRSEDWLAAGPSASGHVAGARWKNAPHLGRYLESTGLAPLSEWETPPAATQLSERLLMALRLSEGVEIDATMRAAAALGRDAALAACMDRFAAEGSIVADAGRWRLAECSLLIADTIIAAAMRSVDP